MLLGAAEKISELSKNTPSVKPNYARKRGNQLIPPRLFHTANIRRLQILKYENASEFQDVIERPL